jgi:hypothetical protein
MGESLRWGGEKNQGEQGNARGSSDNNDEYDKMMMTLPLPLPQTGWSMSANNIGQNKVTINPYCQRWQLLKEEKWQKGRLHDGGQLTKGMRTTIKQRSRGGGGWQWRQ